MTELRGDKGRLRMTTTSGGTVIQKLRLAFYRDDYVLEFEDQPAAHGPRQPSGRLLGERANFLRDSNGRVAWLRFHGRLNRKVS